MTNRSGRLGCTALRMVIAALTAGLLTACGGGADVESGAPSILEQSGDFIRVREAVPIAISNAVWASDEAVPGETSTLTEPLRASVASDASPSDGFAPDLQGLHEDPAALSHDERGQRMQAMGTVPSGAAAPVPSIAPADIVYALNPADLSTYRFSTVACMGGNNYWWVWGGSQGRYLTTTLFPLREPGGVLRAGIVPDPDDPGSLAFESSVKPTDADTSGAGNKRCEIALGWTEYRYPGKLPARKVTLPRNRDFWWAIKFRLEDWRTTRDRQVIFQWLPGFTTSAGPMMSVSAWGDALRMELHHDYGPSPSSQTMTKLVPWTFTGWHPNRWYTMVMRARIDARTPFNGKLAVWLDGALVLDYRGPIGYTSPTEGDYAKFGLYHWIGGNPWDMSVIKRTAWYKGPALVLDQPGYTADAVAAVIK